MTTVALIEDDEAYRSCLADILRESGRYVLAGSFASATEALARAPSLAPQVILLDVQHAGESGITALARLHRRWPRARCVVLTGSDTDADLFAALRAGAGGYLLKSDSREQLIAALDDLVAGGAPLSRSIARRVVASFAQPATRSTAGANLTLREREILQRLADGSTYKEIADTLGISRATVKNHLYRIYDKLEVRSRTEAVVKWLKWRDGREPAKST